ncbi:hypothetical protein Tco_0755398 [Tanacetum coccineum]
MENKVVQSHIRGEYVSLFLNLCAILRIRHQFIAFETPTIELLKEKNHALEDMINAMFLSLGLSHGMWGKRQRDDNDLQDERQDQPKEEEVEPRRRKRARTKKSFGSDFVSFMVENEPTSYREADEITYVREKWVRFEWNYEGRNSLEILQNQASVHDHNEYDYEDLTRSRRLSAPHKIQRISLIGFPAQSVGSSNTDVLDLPCLLVLITGTSQSRQHVITSLIHIESCKSPTKSLFDVGSSRISIFTVNT